MLRSPRWFVPALAFALAVPAARATTMIPQSLDQLAAGSWAVVRVTTLETHAAWTANRVIVTTAHARITESLAGPLRAGQEIDVATLGGTVDGTSLIVEDAPHFAAGTDAVLFLEAGSSSPYHVTSLAQGKFDVHRDTAGRESLSRDDLEGAGFALRGLPRGPLSLSDLRQRVRSAQLAR
ncbi:MAG TPA: hypothetical protein VMI75_37365 [Polyangiaceae bacterium]|nr:hypothetical protein [Polyangiaceae bacterium]